jgi:hypothetical protein
MVVFGATVGFSQSASLHPSDSATRAFVSKIFPASNDLGGDGHCFVAAGVSPAGEPGVPPGGPTIRQPGILDVSGFESDGIGGIWDLLLGI